MKKKVTLSDIGRELGISKTTVSLVLNNKPNNISSETKKRIFDKAKELNYVPNFLAKSLSTKKTHTIGLIMPDIQNPFFSEMAKTIGNIAEKSNYTVIIFNTLNEKLREEEGIKHLIGKGVDGIILVPLGNKCESINILKDNKVPFVISDRIIENNSNINSVSCNSIKGIKLGVNHLYNKERRNIAYISGETESNIIKLRLEAYIEESKKLNIYSESLCEIADISLEGGFSAVEKLIKRNEKIDGIMCCSDILAIGALKYLIRNGYKIPEDINILGFDNIDICKFIEPELSTIAQPISEIGEKSIKILIDCIDGKNSEKQEVILEPKIIERNT